MDFKTAVTTVLTQKYADFTGRACRSEYWWWVLGYALTYIAIAVISGIVLGRFTMRLPSLFVLAVALPTLAVGVRRLHDLEKSGWWLLIGLVPFVADLILLYFVSGLILLYFFVQRGTAGPNLYGPDPLPQAITAA